jgi:hypothetical protein
MPSELKRFVRDRSGNSVHFHAHGNEGRHNEFVSGFKRLFKEAVSGNYLKNLWLTLLFRSRISRSMQKSTKPPRRALFTMWLVELESMLVQ